MRPELEAVVKTAQEDALLAYTPEPRLLTPQQVADVKWRAEWLLQWVCEHSIDGDGLAIMHAKAILATVEAQRIAEGKA